MGSGNTASDGSACLPCDAPAACDKSAIAGRESDDVTTAGASDADTTFAGFFEPKPLATVGSTNQRNPTARQTYTARHPPTVAKTLCPFRFLKSTLPHPQHREHVVGISRVRRQIGSRVEEISPAAQVTAQVKPRPAAFGPTCARWQQEPKRASLPRQMGGWSRPHPQKMLPGGSHR
jgi:hypothetical protein